MQQGPGIVKGGASFTGGGTADTTAAIVVPGNSPEIVNLAIDWNMGDLAMEILGPNPGFNSVDAPLIGYDVLNVQGAGNVLSLQGTISITLGAGFDPGIGSIFHIITTETGGALDLTSFDLPSFEADLAAQQFGDSKFFTVLQADSSGLSLIVTTPEPASCSLFALSIPAICLTRRKK